MAPALVRKLIDGAWRWIQEEDDPGGGSVTVTQGKYYNMPVRSIPVGESASINWNFREGTEMLAYPDTQANPVFALDGLYLVTVQCVCEDVFTEGGYGQVQLVAGLSESSSGIAFDMEHHPLGCTACVKASAGDQLAVSCLNQDGVEARRFGMDNGLIVRVE